MNVCQNIQSLLNNLNQGQGQSVVLIFDITFRLKTRFLKVP